MKIYRNGIIILDLGYIPDDATEKRTLMQEHSVSFSVELEENIPFRKGDYIIHSGEKFQLAKDVRPTVNENTGGFVYDFVFHHPSERLKDYIFRYEGDPKFDLFASGDQFLTLIINQSGLDLSVGEFPIESRNITFENVDLFSALNLIAEEYQMEWWINNGLINLGKCEFGEAISLSYDVEVKSISLSDSTERIITRLYAYGSDRNTGKALQIPPIDLYPDMPEDQVIEGVVQFDVYPKQINKITSVETEILPETPDTQETYIYTIGADNTFTITPEVILPGKPLKISFLTGDLMGEDFELILRGDKFEIKFEEDNGVYTPNEFIKPNIGDEFFFYNIKAETIMPGLIQEAKDRLLIEATNFLENTKHHYVYDISTHSIEALEKGIDLEIGQRVILSGPTIGVVESRVQSYSKDLNNRFDATYQIGVNPQYSRLADIEKTALDNKYKILRSAGLTSDQIRILIRTIGKGEFISKTGDDTAQGLIQFSKGISVEELAAFSNGLTSEGLATFSKGISVEELAAFSNGLTSEGLATFLKGISVEELAAFSNGLTSEGLATFLKGISVEELAELTQGLEIGDYTSGLLGGGGAFKMKDGLSELEVDKLTVRMIATFFEIVVSKLRHINGGLVLSQGAITCSRVVEHADSYQCFFERGDNNEISNTFVVNDQARCQVFRGGKQKFYWRLVTEVGDDWIKLSKTVGIGDSIPAAGDDIVQLGYQGKDLAHVKRLNAQIIDESGISQYVEIDSFTLEGKRRNFISADGTGSQFTGKVSFKNAGVDYDLSDWAYETETAIEGAIEGAGSKTFFAKPTKYKRGDRWVLTEDTQLLDNLYLKGQMLEAVYDSGKDSDWRLMLIEGDEEATEGINLIRNYDFREGAKHWGATEDSIVELGDELPTEFYTPSINVLGDEYGYEYAITSENDELIILDE